MRVVVEILTGKLFYIQIHDNATVQDLKRKIGDQEKLPLDRIILVLDNNLNHLMSENEVSLVDYGVQDGSHVYLFFNSQDEGSANQNFLLNTSQDSLSTN